jgi:hypothetical protein
VSTLPLWTVGSGGMIMVLDNGAAMNSVKKLIALVSGSGRLSMELLRFCFILGAGPTNPIISSAVGSAGAELYIYGAASLYADSLAGDVSFTVNNMADGITGMGASFIDETQTGATVNFQ